MRWDRSRRSTNIEDYRGRRTGGPGLKLGVGGTLLALLAAYLLGVDPRLVLGLTDSLPAQSRPDPATGVPEDEAAQFMAAVLGDTEDTWGTIFDAAGERYVPPTLVLFSGQVRSGCGFASAGAGPFYCPADERIYVDLAFYDQLKTQFQAPGDFACFDG